MKKPIKECMQIACILFSCRKKHRKNGGNMAKQAKIHILQHEISVKLLA